MKKVMLIIIILLALAIVVIVGTQVKTERIAVPTSETQTLATSTPAAFPPLPSVASWTRYADPAGRVSFSVPPGYRIVADDREFRLMPAEGPLRERAAVTIFLEDNNTIHFSADPDVPEEFALRFIAASAVRLPQPEAPASAPVVESAPIFSSAPPSASVITETPIVHQPPPAPPPPTDVIGYLCTLPNRSDANPDGTKRDKVFRSTDGLFYWRSGPDIWMYYDAAARFVALCPWDEWCLATLPGLTFSATDLCASRQ